MNNKKILVYPKGFLGYENSMSVSEPATGLDEIITAIKLDKEIPKKKSGVSNHDITGLYRQFANGTQYVTQFEYREKIMLAALSAFGTYNFREWLELQARSPFYTTMHRRFLTDTLNFILYGKREMPVLQWDSLIVPTEVNSLDRNVLVDVNGFFRDDKGIWLDGINMVGQGMKPSVQLEEVLHQWTSREDGHADLIATLHVFFGAEQR